MNPQTPPSSWDLKASCILVAVALYCGFLTHLSSGPPGPESVVLGVTQFACFVGATVLSLHYLRRTDVHK